MCITRLEAWLFKAERACFFQFIADFTHESLKRDAWKKIGCKLGAHKSCFKGLYFFLKEIKLC